jgi:hypothetical protein
MAKKQTIWIVLEKNAANETVRVQGVYDAELTAQVAVEGLQTIWGEDRGYKIEQKTGNAREWRLFAEICA